nr:hypothetical protein [Bacteroidota bacterium]
THGGQYSVVTDDSSTYYAISTTFSDLASTITADDFLFVWVMSHGGTDPFSGSSYFYSYDNQKVYDSDLATWLGNIDAHKKVVSKYSGTKHALRLLNANFLKQKLI